MTSGDVLYFSEICDAFGINYTIHKIASSKGKKIVASCRLEAKKLLSDSFCGNFEIHINKKEFILAESAKYYIEYLIKNLEK